MKSWIILTAAYEDCESLSRLLGDIRHYLPFPFSVVAVDDGSLEKKLTPQIWQQNGINGDIVRLTHNISNQRALAVGISYVAEQYPEHPVVIMDADGEDAPQNIPRLIELLQNRKCDIVVATRNKRHNGWFFSIFYWFYKFFFWLLTGKLVNFGNFSAHQPHAIKRLSAMPELWMQIPGCLLQSRLNLVAVKINREKRYFGQSKMNFTHLVLHAFRGVMVFAESVLVRLGILCALMTLATLSIILIILWMKYLGIPSPGWATMVIINAFVLLMQIGALTLISLLVIGSNRSQDKRHNYRDYVEEVINIVSSDGTPRS